MDGCSSIGFRPAGAAFIIWISGCLGWSVELWEDVVLRYTADWPARGAFSG